ncbi:hypothetical protein QJQ45_003903 [Haematococcus lacustris]|nr:hypothetical protein QJQ45_003903 [Haematococcus lacustris]
MKRSSAGDVNKGQQPQGLQGLPAELLDAVLSQLDASSRLPVFRTSKLLATALLRVVPSVELTYPTPHDIIGEHLRELAPFLTEVLQNRQQPKLHLTLQRARGFVHATEQSGEAEPAAVAAVDASQLVAWMLEAVPLCGAVDSLAIDLRPEKRRVDGRIFIELHGYLDLPWEPELSESLATSFPSVTSLTFHGASISIGDLANAISHPLLLPQLLHLDFRSSSLSHEGQFGSPPFLGSRLQTLKVNGLLVVDGQGEFLSGLLPFPTTLTQLEVKLDHWHEWEWDSIAAAVSSLTQLQQLVLYHDNVEDDRVNSEFMALLPALAHLPSLHTLVMYEDVVGLEQLDALLALTQITSLEVLTFSGLASSRASAACSWRQLRVWDLDWVTAAYLPLHSLTHPLELKRLVGAVEIGDNEVEEPSLEVLAAAELNLCERNKAGLVLEDDVSLSQATVDLLTELYLSIAQQPTHPTVASSSSHSGPSTSLASSSSPEGHITPGGPGSSTGQGGQQGGSAAGAQPLMQRLGRCVKVVEISGPGLSEESLSSDNRQALAVLFPKAHISFAWQNTA